MVAAHEITPEPGGDDPRFVLRRVPWWTYVAMRDALDDSRLHMTYLQGMLELMSPSENHEEIKELIGRLLEAWADEMDVDLRGFGGATFRNEQVERGAEPDGCYSLGAKVDGAPPHLAIEVIMSNPLVDKLDVYAGLGVDEVWTWRRDRSLTVHVRRGPAFEMRDRSTLLPQLDLVLLASFVRIGESHTALAKAYRAPLRGG